MSLASRLKASKLFKPGINRIVATVAIGFVIGALLLILLFLPRSQQGETKTIAPGFRIEDVTVGQGDVVRVGDHVSVHFEARTGEGKLFDSTRETGTPLEFQLGSKQVLMALERGIEGMRPGGRRKLFLSSAHAYGETGLGEKVPPHSDVVFDIELLGIRR